MAINLHWPFETVALNRLQKKEYSGHLQSLANPLSFLTGVEFNKIKRKIENGKKTYNYPHRILYSDAFLSVNINLYNQILLSRIYGQETEKDHTVLWNTVYSVSMDQILCFVLKKQFPFFIVHFLLWNLNQIHFH